MLLRIALCCQPFLDNPKLPRFKKLSTQKFNCAIDNLRPGAKKSLTPSLIYCYCFLLRSLDLT